MFIAQYSKSQNCFHVEQEMDVLEKEIRAYEQRGWIGDYETLGRFETRQEAIDFIKPLKAIRDLGTN